MVQSLHVFLHPSLRQSVHPSVPLPNRHLLTPSVYQCVHRSISLSISWSVYPSITHLSNSRKISGIFNHTTIPVLVLYMGASLGSWPLALGFFEDGEGKIVGGKGIQVWSRRNCRVVNVSSRVVKKFEEGEGKIEGGEGI